MLIEALISSTGVVFLAELGDKTMLATMCFSAQCRKPLLVLVASMLALTCATVLAVVAGTVLAAALPLQLIIYLSAIIFLSMSVYTLVEIDSGTGDTNKITGTFLGMASLVFVSELGDKTQLACLALAAESPYPVAIFIGAIAGFFAANSIAAVAGHRLAGSIPIRVIRGATATVFIIIGALVLLGVL